MATTLEAIQTRIDKLKAKADALLAKQSSGIIKKIRELMATHGLTTADIEAHAAGKQRATNAVVKTMSKGSVAVVKYRDPKTGATWSGHGRAPGWIASAKNRDKFLVDGSTASAKPVSASKAKTAGNYVRGPQPAMYRDPRSGATWSGRGRAPTWIADAKDRAKFLIADGAEATVATTAGTVSKSKAAAKNASNAVGATAGKGQRKGPQPTMYLNPKSGATWSGRGRAPAWLAGVKDRSKFLIDGGVAMSASKAGAVSNAGKPKVAGKKAAPRESTVMDVSAAKKAVAGKKAPAKRPAVKKVAAKKVGSANAISSNTDSTVAPAASAVLSA